MSETIPKSRVEIMCHQRAQLAWPGKEKVHSSFACFSSSKSQSMFFMSPPFLPGNLRDILLCHWHYAKHWLRGWTRPRQPSSNLPDPILPHGTLITQKKGRVLFSVEDCGWVTFYEYLQKIPILSPWCWAVFLSPNLYIPMSEHLQLLWYVYNSNTGHRYHIFNLC